MATAKTFPTRKHAPKDPGKKNAPVSADSSSAGSAGAGGASGGGGGGGSVGAAGSGGGGALSSALGKLSTLAGAVAGAVGGEIGAVASKVAGVTGAAAGAAAAAEGVAASSEIGGAGGSGATGGAGASGAGGSSGAAGSAGADGASGADGSSGAAGTDGSSNGSGNPEIGSTAKSSAKPTTTLSTSGGNRVQGSYNDGTTSASGDLSKNRVAGSVKKDDKWASVSLQRDGSLALAGGSKEFGATFNKDSKGRTSGFGDFKLGNNSSLKLGGASNGSFRIKGVSPEINGEVTRNGMGVVKALGSYTKGDTRIEGAASNTGAASIFGEKGDSYAYLGRTAEGDIHSDSSSDIRKALKKMEHLASEIGKVKRDAERRSR